MKFLIGIIPIFLYALLIGYYAVYIRPEISGDLSKLGATPDNKDYVQKIKETGYPENMVIEYQKQDTISRIITIGDSFSNCHPNNYPNCLGHILGEQVTNIPIDFTYILPQQALALMVSQGFFEKHNNVEIVILELVQRNILADQLSHPVPEGRKDLPLREINKPKPQTDFRNSLSTILDDGNKWISNTLGKSDQVKISDLNSEAFTMKGNEKKLYFYFGDLNITSPDEIMLKTIKTNLTSLYNLLESKGVKLLFMIIPDKYQLYQGLIENNKYPKSNGGDKLIQYLDTVDYVVNILPALRKELASGEKDLYIATDTHWSGKGAKIGAKELAEKISPKLK